MQSIVLLTGNHLCHNPRAMKEASALARAGFEVEVLGGWYNASLKARDLDLLTRRSGLGARYRFDILSVYFMPLQTCRSSNWMPRLAV
jgi:hypothetical protein